MRDIVITSSVLILAVLLIRQLAKGRLAPALQYALWFPVVLRLLLPLPLWNSSFSVLNLFSEERIADSIERETDVFFGQSAVNEEKTVEKGSLETEAPHTAGIAADMADSENIQNSGESHFVQNNGGFQAVREQASETEAVLSKKRFSLAECLPYIWAAGMLLVGGYMLFYQIKWNRYLRANRIPLTGRATYNGLSVYTVEGLPSPCLTGRRIYLTEEMAENPERLEHILAHEYCHYKQLDSLWVIVRCVLTAVYWFHPLVWAAAYVSKQDSELACDAAAIRLLGEEERIAYGKTLLCLITGNGYGRNRIGLASTMSGGEKGIRERIFRIAGKPQYMAMTAGVVLLLIAAVIAVTFSGTKEAQEQDGQTGENGNVSALAESGNGQEGQNAEPGGEQAAELQPMQQELDARMTEELKQLEALEAEKEEMLEVLAQEQKRLEEEAADAAREQAIFEKLAFYDAHIDAFGSREGVFGITGALNLSDYVQAYYENGDEAMEEGMYLLETHKGPDSSDIKIYGMYSEEYGCEGIKILIGDDVNDFDEEWFPSYMLSLEENLRVYESAEDGMPRTFACRMVAENTSDREFWNLYVGDRYNTGRIELYTVRPAELLGQVREQVSFEINAEESRIDVYSNGEKSGSIAVDASAEAMKSIEAVLLGDEGAGWKLGGSEEEIRMLLPIALRLKTTDELWYGRLPMLSVSVSCGSFGDRKTEIGQVSADTAYVSGKGLFQRRDWESLDQYLKSLEENFQADSSQNENPQQAGSPYESADMDILAGVSADGVHYDVEIQYSNPCPSYTRIADSFGVRTNPVTGEQRAHNGIDFAADMGADVLAAADGTVYQTGFDFGNGNYIILYHVMSGEYTYYTHCQEILVTEGDSVTAGQEIATVGSTGRSTGPHLHFALSRDGEYVEPVFE